MRNEFAFARNGTVFRSLETVTRPAGRMVSRPDGPL